MADAPQKTVQSTQHVYVDRPDLAETFADSLQSVFFDGQTVRMEFCVTHFGEPKAQEALVGKRYPACRLVLTPGAAVELINQVQRMAARFVQAGILKADPGKQADAAKPAAGATAAKK